MKALGKAIAKQRHDKGLSLRDAAAKSSVSHQTIALVENGEASLETMLKVAFAIGLRSDDVRYYAVRDIGRMTLAAAAA